MSCDNQSFRSNPQITSVSEDSVLDNLSPKRVVITDSNSELASSPITDQELLYLDGARSNLQDQIDALSGGITTGDLISATSVLSISGGSDAIIGSGVTITLSQASSLSSGFLSNTDWNTFNSKLSDSLSEGNIFVGNASGTATEQAVGGDLTMDFLGDFTIKDGVIENSNVAASAAIQMSKLQPLSANRVAVTGPTGYITAGLISATELNYLDNVTSNIQSQLDGKLSVLLSGSADGDILVRSGGVYTNLPATVDGYVLKLLGGSPVWAAETTSTLPAGGTATQALLKQSGTDYDADWEFLTLTDISDFPITVTELNILSGGTISTTELNYLEGAESNIQAQIDNIEDQLALIPTTVTYTGNKAVITTAAGALTTSTTSSTEIFYLSGVTSNVQTQLDGKLDYGGTAPSSGDILYFDGVDWVNLAAGADGEVLKLSSGVPTWGTDISGGSGGLPAGGTLGQYLTKDSATDFDATWKDLIWSQITDTTASLTEINYVAGVTSAIQTQLNTLDSTKQDNITGAATTIATSNLTANRAVISSAGGKIIVSDITATEISYLDDVTSNIQTQLDGKLDYAGSSEALGDLVWYDGTDFTNLSVGTDGQILSNSSGTLTWIDAPTSGFSLPSGGAITNILQKTNGVEPHTLDWAEFTLANLEDVDFATSVTSQDLLYNNGSDWTRFPVGTDGQVLSVNGGNLAWTSVGAQSLQAAYNGGDSIILDPSGSVTITDDSGALFRVNEDGVTYAGGGLSQSIRGEFGDYSSFEVSGSRMRWNSASLSDSFSLESQQFRTWVYNGSSAGELVVNPASSSFSIETIGLNPISAGFSATTNSAGISVVSTVGTSYMRVFDTHAQYRIFGSSNDEAGLHLYQDGSDWSSTSPTAIMYSSDRASIQIADPDVADGKFNHLTALDKNFVSVDADWLRAVANDGTTSTVLTMFGNDTTIKSFTGVSGATGDEQYRLTLSGSEVKIDTPRQTSYLYTGSVMQNQIYSASGDLRSNITLSESKALMNAIDDASPRNSRASITPNAALIDSFDGTDTMGMMATSSLGYASIFYGNSVSEFRVNDTVARMTVRDSIGGINGVEMDVGAVRPYLKYTSLYDPNTTDDSRLASEEWVKNAIKVTSGSGAPATDVSPNTWDAEIYIDTSS